MALQHWHSFVTPGLYHDLARENKENWEHFLGQEVEIVEYPDQGSWEKNCLQRSQLLFKRATFSSMTGMLDADVVFKSAPSLLLGPEKGRDLYIRKTGDVCLSRYFSAAILLVAPTAPGLAFLRNWAELCKKNSANTEIGLREQYFLYEAWEHKHPAVLNLPETYCFTPPRNNLGAEAPTNTVVQHLPAKWLWAAAKQKAATKPVESQVDTPLLNGM